MSLLKRFGAMGSSSRKKIKKDNHLTKKKKVAIAFSNDFVFAAIDDFDYFLRHYFASL